MNRHRFILLAGMIFAAVASRLIPHPPNFTPIAAHAVFSGAQFSDKRPAFALPLGAMFLSDLILGLHVLIPVIYATFALVTGFGLWVGQQQNIWRIGGAAMAGAILFFVVTNFAVWAAASFYPKTGRGLASCHVEAIPFWKYIGQRFNLYCNSFWRFAQGAVAVAGIPSGICNHLK